MTVDFDKLLTDTLGDPRDVEAPPGSINAELLALPVQRKYAGHEVRGKVFLFPRTGIIGVPYREQGDHWGVIVTDGSGGPRKENGQEVYPHGGYDISVSALEMQTAIELSASVPEARVLPSFVDDHVLVQFHRDKDEDGRERILKRQTADEAELQQKLTEWEEDHLDEDYASHDTIVVENIGAAHGVTSWDAKASTQESEMHRIMLDIDFPAALIPSSTPGHFHLYLDKLIKWEDYSELLDFLGSIGVIEEGYAQANIARGYSSLRLPWVEKSVGQVRAKRSRPGRRSDADGNLLEERCNGCAKHPTDLPEYAGIALDEGYGGSLEAMRKEEGTYNRANGHFWCNGCYIGAGMPLGVAK